MFPKNESGLRYPALFGKYVRTFTGRRGPEIFASEITPKRYQVAKGRCGSMWHSLLLVFKVNNSCSIMVCL